MSEAKGKVAVIGLGSMGMGIAQSLLRAGFDVTGCDVNAQALTQFSQAGGGTVESPSQIDSRRSVVICAVVNSQQMETVLFSNLETK